MPIPSPKERPDLYDYFDFPDRPPSWKSSIETPDWMLKRDEQRKARKAAERLAKAKTEPAGE